jgi:outer membrane protein OmpA-like peptidoglycan-associated protein/tetratricopeptide (TPR) repeat protein
MKKIAHIIVFLLAFIQFKAQAQFELEKGKLLFHQNRFDEAIAQLKIAAQKNPDIQKKYEAILLLAKCNDALNKPEEVERWYRNAVSGRYRKSGVAAFKADVSGNLINYGIAQRNNGKYEEAKATFLDALKEDSTKRNTINYYIAACDSAISWSRPTEVPAYDIKEAKKLNTTGREMSPCIYIDTVLVFSGGTDVASDLDLRKVAFNPTLPIDKLPASRSFGEGLNSSSHEGPATFTAEGKKVFFTRTVVGEKDREKREQRDVLNIFYSEYTDGKWTTPTNDFPFNSLDYNTAHPSITPDGKRLYFMCDKDGGFGKADLYYSEFDGNKWSIPFNLGEVINTEGNELFPSIQGDTLFFSSDMHPGMGKLDVFMSVLVRKRGGGEVWTKPENLKPPFNTIYDEFGVTFFGGQQRGFFTSNRKGGTGGDDIYAFLTRPQPTVYLDGFLVKYHNDALFDDVNYSLTKKDGSPVAVESNDIYYFFEPNPQEEYKLSFMKDNLLENEANIKHGGRPTRLEYLKVDFFSTPKPLKVVGFLKDGNNNTLPGEEVLVLKQDIPFDTIITDPQGKFNYVIPPEDDYTIIALTEEGKKEFLKRGFITYEAFVASTSKAPVPNVAAALSINGRHWGNFSTDKNGQFSFKAISGQKIKLELEKPNYKEIDTAFVAQAAPEQNKVRLNFTMRSMPKASAIINGIVLHKAEPVPGTQITVYRNNKIEQMMPTDDNGRFQLRLQENEYYNVLATQEGFFQFDTTILTDNITVGKQLVINLNPIELNKEIRLENIYYDYNKFNIRADAKPTLNKIVTFLEKNPKAVIELNAHTDERGEEDYNLKLSQKRAESARNYLLVAGIKSTRITAKGYGETMPLIPVARSEFEHQVNRRTQFKVLGYIDFLSMNEKELYGTPELVFLVHATTSEQLLEPTNLLLKIYSGKLKTVLTSNNTIKYYIGPFKNKSDADRVIEDLGKIGYNNAAIEAYENYKIAIGR